ncbi:MAG: hypothetical protein LBR91_01375 [Puniceicoccales bacterium]|jgi:hypothetical protein|nr:hypothetical protein [Puniceicoccales bacterium]
MVPRLVGRVVYSRVVYDLKDVETWPRCRLDGISSVEIPPSVRVESEGVVRPRPTSTIFQIVEHS